MFDVDVFFRQWLDVGAENSFFVHGGFFLLGLGRGCGGLFFVHVRHISLLQWLGVGAEDLFFVHVRDGPLFWTWVWKTPFFFFYMYVFFRTFFTCMWSFSLHIDVGVEDSSFTCTW